MDLQMTWSPYTQLKLQLHYGAQLKQFMKLISNDDKHIVYRSIGVNEIFLRYLKVIKELHRNDLHDLSREEKLVLYINLYNMVQFMKKNLYTISTCIIWCNSCKCAVGLPRRASIEKKNFHDFKCHSRLFLFTQPSKMEFWVVPKTPLQFA